MTPEMQQLSDSVKELTALLNIKITNLSSNLKYCTEMLREIKREVVPEKPKKVKVVHYPEEELPRTVMDPTTGQEVDIPKPNEEDNLEN